MRERERKREIGSWHKVRGREGRTWTSELDEEEERKEVKKKGTETARLLLFSFRPWFSLSLSLLCFCPRVSDSEYKLKREFLIAKPCHGARDPSDHGEAISLLTLRTVLSLSVQTQGHTSSLSLSSSIQRISLPQIRSILPTISCPLSPFFCQGFILRYFHTHEYIHNHIYIDKFVFTVPWQVLQAKEDEVRDGLPKIFKKTENANSSFTIPFFGRLIWQTDGLNLNPILLLLSVWIQFKKYNIFFILHLQSYFCSSSRGIIFENVSETKTFLEMRCKCSFKESGLAPIQEQMVPFFRWRHSL